MLNRLTKIAIFGLLVIRLYSMPVEPQKGKFVDYGYLTWGGEFYHLDYDDYGPPLDRSPNKGESFKVNEGFFYRYSLSPPTLLEIHQADEWREPVEVTEMYGLRDDGKFNYAKRDKRGGYFFSGDGEVGDCVVTIVDKAPSLAEFGLKDLSLTNTVDGVQEWTKNQHEKTIWKYIPRWRTKNFDKDIYKWKYNVEVTPDGLVPKRYHSEHWHFGKIPKARLHYRSYDTYIYKYNQNIPDGVMKKAMEFYQNCLKQDPPVDS